MANGTMNRRKFLAGVSALGVAGTGFVDRLWAEVEKGHPVTPKVLAEAEKLAGLEFTEEERELMLEGVQDLTDSYEALRTVSVPNSVPPAYRFDPLTHGGTLPDGDDEVRWTPVAGIRRPSEDAELAYMSIAEQGRLLRDGEITSVELTRVYLDRMERYDPMLHLVITSLKDQALEDAERADRELAEGRDRGPLHGIPWGAKDLLAVAGHRTTWGAKPFEDQVLDEDATVVTRLRDAGAVLLAKLSLGALAWGDVWYGGKTRNPWDPEQGSSGSSAGSASAAAGGLAGFAIGSETWGSIVSPSTRCGATGLRPTFGQISRHGAMALSWTMDKLGPICRTVEDCALVYHAIHGTDGLDPTAVDTPFVYRPDRDVRRLKVGWVPALFEEPADEDKPEWWDPEWFAHDQATLEVLKDLGIDLVPLELPDLPIGAMSFVLGVEAAAAFDELTRSGRDDLLVRQVQQAWPNSFRESRMVPAVEYVQANRVRTMAMDHMREMLADVDVYVTPSFGGDHLLLTNLTGHPCVVVPNGFRENGTPTSITFQGRLYEDGKVLEIAKAYQDATDHHRVHPDLEAAKAAWEARDEDDAAEHGDDVAALDAGYRMRRRRTLLT